MNKSKPLEGKVAVVTGAGSGMGQATAIRLAGEGAKISLLDVNKDNIQETKRVVETSGGEALVLGCDISIAKQVQLAINETVSHWGQIDILFANAGIAGEMSPIESLKVEDWDKTLSINLKGTFLTVKYVIPYMKKEGGSIIITSSVSGNRMFSQAGFTAYSTTKAGQIAFMKMAALELARYSIRVNAICPGAIETNIGESLHFSPNVKEVEIPVRFPEGEQPLEHGPGTKHQIADLVSFLSSDASSHITGTEIYIDGAESLLH
ncbi:SDR family oxidoreductase [Bacillus solitudinis]|uniref:SDR family oxidoreductase n=1 Tax=Bacillus solitudinis TaxID=2014074 RepID=UPI000C24E6B7|nr:SDR family NAD(P)-dependent oxidoreductase [Bacillus solitudinis]